MSGYFDYNQDDLFANIEESPDEKTPQKTNQTPQDLSANPQKKVSYFQLKADLFRQGHGQSMAFDDKSHSKHSVVSKDAKKETALEVMKSKAVAMLHKRIEKYREKLKKSSALLEDFKRMVPKRKKKSAATKSRSQMFGLVKLLVERQCRLKEDQRGQCGSVCGRTRCEVGVQTQVSADDGLNRFDIKGCSVGVPMTSEPQLSQQQLQEVDVCSRSSVKSSQTGNHLSIPFDSHLNRNQQIEFSVRYEDEGEVQVEGREMNRGSGTDSDSVERSEEGDSNLDESQSERDQVAVGESGELEKEVVGEENSGPIERVMRDPRGVGEKDGGAVDRVLGSQRGVVERVSIASVVLLFGDLMRLESSSGGVEEVRRCSEGLLKVVSFFERFAKQGFKGHSSLSELLFDFNNTQTVERRMAMNTAQLSVDCNSQISMAVLKVLTVIALLQYNSLLSIGHDRVSVVLNVEFPNKHAQSLNRKFMTMMFKEWPVECDQFKKASGRPNHFSLAHNLFNAVFQLFEKVLIFRDNSEVFERRELAKRTLSSAFKGLCQYVITMKELEDSRVDLFDDPNDFLASFVLLFELPQTVPLNHQYAKTLRSIYQNPKFTNTQQEFISLFVSTHLKV